MYILNWERLFKGHILDRGYNYFCDGAVDNIQRSEDKINAIVCGSEDYEVEILFEGDKITDMYCSCPYAEDGNRCKHMVAVLFEWEANRELENLEKPQGEVILTDKPSTTDEVEDIIKLANEKQIKEFLSYVLHNDEKLFVRFKTLINPEISNTEMDCYKRQIDATINEYLGREHFISYYKAYDFISDMETYLYEDVRMMLDSGCYWNAFELTCYLFIEVGEVDMDDSDGGTGMFADQCMQIWEEILDYADEETEDAIYTWFTEHLNGSIIDYMEEYIENILMERFTKEKYLKAKLEYTERKVTELKQVPESWSSNYQAAKWSLRHIRLMEETGYPKVDIDCYCKQNWKYSDIRKYYISKCEEQGNYKEAIEVLKESMELDSQQRGLVNQYSFKLKEIYKLSGNMEAYKQQLWHLITKDNPGNIESFKELKTLYSNEEWEKIREEIFSGLPKYAHVDQLYKEEKLYDRLLEYVLSTEGLYALREYEKELKDYYPEEILQKYADEVNRMATHTADRRRYQEWVAILRRMSKIKGGKEKVCKIVEHWRFAYRNRPAMMDELRKL